MQQTVVMVKPHAVASGWAEQIRDRYVREGFNVRFYARGRLSRTLVENFYREHRDRPFFGQLVDTMTSSDTVVMVLEGENAIQRVRTLNGATDPAKAAPGTIRHDFRGPGGPCNTVHGSDSPESAEREIQLIVGWFDQS